MEGEREKGGTVGEGGSFLKERKESSWGCVKEVVSVRMLLV